MLLFLLNYLLLSLLCNNNINYIIIIIISTIVINYCMLFHFRIFYSLMKRARYLCNVFSKQLIFCNPHGMSAAILCSLVSPSTSITASLTATYDAVNVMHTLWWTHSSPLCMTWEHSSHPHGVAELPSTYVRHHTNISGVWLCIHWPLCTYL